MKRYFTLGVLAVALTVGVLSSPADAARVRFGVGVGPTVGVRGVPNYGYRSYARPYYGNHVYRSSFYSPYYGVPYSSARVNSLYYGGGGYGPVYGGSFYGSPYYGGFYGGGNYGGWCN